MIISSIFYAALFALLVAGSASLAQNADPLSFFPHHAGDVWEYTGGNPPVITQERITRDSLGADGRYCLYHTYYREMIVDTASNRALQSPNAIRDTALLFRLDAHFGDHWVYDRFPGGVVIARVRAEFSTILFGHIVQVKKIEYTDSASGLEVRPTEYLGSGFGVIGQDIDTSPDRRLTGAIIGGVQYGTITLAVPEEVLAALSFALGQNYPNPFNPSTNIRFEVGGLGFVSLRVYDVLGREVATLVNEIKPPGEYSLGWDGSGFPSGVYFYRLTTKDGTTTRRMLLLR